MHRFLFFILIISILSNCSRDPVKFRKSQAIPKKDFVSILMEIHLMDAATNHYQFYNIYSSKDTLDTYGGIFEKYGYTKAEFDTTVANYSRQPELYEAVYNEVLMKLNYMLDTLQSNDPMFETEGKKLKQEDVAW